VPPPTISTVGAEYSLPTGEQDSLEIWDAVEALLSPAASPEDDMVGVSLDAMTLQTIAAACGADLLVHTSSCARRASACPAPTDLEHGPQAAHTMRRYRCSVLGATGGRAVHSRHATRTRTQAQRVSDTRAVVGCMPHGKVAIDHFNAIKV
jgi:hypothetical protein